MRVITRLSSVMIAMACLLIVILLAVNFNYIFHFYDLISFKTILSRITLFLQLAIYIFIAKALYVKAAVRLALAYCLLTLPILAFSLISPLTTQLSRVLSIVSFIASLNLVLQTYTSRPSNLLIAFKIFSWSKIVVVIATTIYTLLALMHWLPLFNSVIWLNVVPQAALLYLLIQICKNPDLDQPETIFKYESV